MEKKEGEIKEIGRGMMRRGARRKTEKKKLKELMSPDKRMFSENLGLLWK